MRCTKWCGSLTRMSGQAGCASSNGGRHPPPAVRLAVSQPGAFKEAPPTGLASRSPPHRGRAGPAVCRPGRSSAAAEKATHYDEHALSTQRAGCWMIARMQEGNANTGSSSKATGCHNIERQIPELLPTPLSRLPSSVTHRKAHAHGDHAAQARVVGSAGGNQAGLAHRVQVACRGDGETKVADMVHQLAQPQGLTASWPPLDKSTA